MKTELPKLSETIEKLVDCVDKFATAALINAQVRKEQWEEFMKVVRELPEMMKAMHFNFTKTETVNKEPEQPS